MPGLDEAASRRYQRGKLSLHLLSYDMRTHAMGVMIAGMLPHFNSSWLSLNAWMYGPLDRVPAVRCKGPRPRYWPVVYR